MRDCDTLKEDGIVELTHTVTQHSLADTQVDNIQASSVPWSWMRLYMSEVNTDTKANETCCSVFSISVCTRSCHAECSSSEANFFTNCLCSQWCLCHHMFDKIMPPKIITWWCCQPSVLFLVTVNCGGESSYLANPELCCWSRHQTWDGADDLQHLQHSDKTHTRKHTKLKQYNENDKEQYHYWLKHTKLKQYNDKEQYHYWLKHIKLNPDCKRLTQFAYQIMLSTNGFWMLQKHPVPTVSATD